MIRPSKQHRTFCISTACLFGLLTASALVCAKAEEKKKAGPNVADPAEHSYADPAKGREKYRLAERPVNEARLYDFYQRQADYYMAKESASEIPEILPAYPGLDAGKHGHWGKHNQNNHQDGRWNEIDIGSLHTQVFRAKGIAVLKGISLKLRRAEGKDKNRAFSACFDPQGFSYRAVWEGGFVKFHPFRWGTSRNAELDGNPWFVEKQTGIDGAEGKYHGFYRHGEDVAFSYDVGNTSILDHPSTFDLGKGKTAFFRTLHFTKAGGGFQLRLGSDVHVRYSFEGKFEGNVNELGDGSSWLAVNQVNANTRIALLIQPNKPGLVDILDVHKPGDLTRFIRGGKKAWGAVSVTTRGHLGKPGDQDSPYVVDTLTVPSKTPWNSVMQLSGIGFLPSGDALVSTLAGEIWKVTGINASLRKLTWTRFASGLNQPMGIHIDKDGIFVLDRGQIYRLHDLDKDGEVDFYENYANDFGGYDRSHSHTFGLHRTKDGSFHFTQRESVLRTGPDRKTVEQGWGVRNCMGIGGSPDFFWVAPQEGTWTPASAIIEVNEGEFYGLPKGGKGGTIAAPLCYIPRGVDNSTGGMLQITSGKWGPFQNGFLGFSYGSGLHYLILRDDHASRAQGAVVPLDGEFLSGSIRGAFGPKDGQLYVAGLDGWGDYSAEDGCLHRVRYTGGKIYKPSGFRVYSNGLKIDFTEKLDRAAAEESVNFFAHAWNYEYANRYGSPEFSIKTPKSLGHDRVAVQSVVLLEGGRSIFVEMPELEPVMQLHIRMHLKAADGHDFKTDLFASPMYLEEHFDHENLAPARAGKLTAIALRVSGSGRAKAPVESGEKVEGEREIVVEAAGGLQYLQKELKAKPGEALALKLKNTDVMPHNLVLVAPGSIKKVGEASFAMLNDPDAGKKSYVPNLPEVIAHIPVIDPQTEHVLHLHAPARPGHYPYICTFPGHWQAMRGVLIVE